jgi:hypothetical protein
MVTQGGGKVREPWGGVPYKIDNTELERKGSETFMELETRMLALGPALQRYLYS